MRAASFLLAIALVLSFLPASRAVPADEGKVVRGRYIPTGRSSTSGVVVRYAGGQIRISLSGRISGKVGRTVISRGRVLESGVIGVRGAVQSVDARKRRNTFTAPAFIRLGDGTVFRGKLQGLLDPSQRFSRFFRGKIRTNQNSSFLLRSR